MGTALLAKYLFHNKLQPVSLVKYSKLLMQKTPAVSDEGSSKGW